MWATRPHSGFTTFCYPWLAGGWMIHLVTYDLESPNDTSEDYARVINALKALYPSWCHLEKSVWLVKTTQSATEVRDAVKVNLYPTDILFVARLSGNWGSFNLGSERNDWIKKQAF
jgi:hypothetical protein